MTTMYSLRIGEHLREYLNDTRVKQSVFAGNIKLSQARLSELLNGNAEFTLPEITRIEEVTGEPLIKVL